jgi:hypothetical protein
LEQQQQQQLDKRTPRLRRFATLQFSIQCSGARNPSGHVAWCCLGWCRLLENVGLAWDVRRPTEEQKAKYRVAKSSA